MTYLLPNSPINTEAEALRAARASAIAIFIGVVVGIIGAVWLLMNPQIIAEAAAQAEAQTPGTGGGAKFGMYFGYAMVLVQLILGFIQWRSPNKIIAFIFMALIVLGFLLTAATPLFASMVPNMPATPVWQIALSLVVMAVQFVLHLTGVKGISKLNQLQMDAAR